MCWLFARERYFPTTHPFNHVVSSILATREHILFFSPCKHLMYIIKTKLFRFTVGRDNLLLLTLCHNFLALQSQAAKSAYSAWEIKDGFCGMLINDHSVGVYLSVDLIYVRMHF